MVTSSAEAGREQAGDQGAVPRSRCQAEISVREEGEEHSSEEMLAKAHTLSFVRTDTDYRAPGPGARGEMRYHRH